jgi:hypothetical protein
MEWFIELLQWEEKIDNLSLDELVEKLDHYNKMKDCAALDNEKVTFIKYHSKYMYVHKVLKKKLNRTC